MFFRSPRGTSARGRRSADLLTGTDSPVSADSSTYKLSARIRRTSAGMRSPLSRATMSPGTRSAAGIRSHTPPRSTRAVGADSSLSAARDRSARTSCTKPKMAFKKTMAMMAAASRYSPKSPEMSVAASRTSTMKSLNWLRNTMKGEIFFPSLSRLGPTAFSLLSASPLSRPTAGSTSKWAATRSASHSTQRLFSDTSTPPLRHIGSVSPVRWHFLIPYTCLRFHYIIHSMEKVCQNGIIFMWMRRKARQEKSREENAPPACESPFPVCRPPDGNRAARRLPGIQPSRQQGRQGRGGDDQHPFPGTEGRGVEDGLQGRVIDHAEQEKDGRQHRQHQGAVFQGVPLEDGPAAPAVENVDQLRQHQRAEGHRLGPRQVVGRRPVGDPERPQAGQTKQHPAGYDLPARPPGDEGLPAVPRRPAARLLVRRVPPQRQRRPAVRHHVDQHILDRHHRQGQARQHGQKHRQDLSLVARQK